MVLVALAVASPYSSRHSRMPIVPFGDSLGPLEFASPFLPEPSCHCKVVRSVFWRDRPFRPFQETKNQRAT